MDADEGSPNAHLADERFWGGTNVLRLDRAGSYSTEYTRKKRAEPSSLHGWLFGHVDLTFMRLLVQPVLFEDQFQMRATLKGENGEISTIHAQLSRKCSLLSKAVFVKKNRMGSVC